MPSVNALLVLALPLWVGCRPDAVLGFDARSGGHDPLSIRVRATIRKPVAHSLRCEADGDVHAVDSASDVDDVRLHAMKPSTVYQCSVAFADGTSGEPVAVTTPALPDDLQLPTITVPAAEPAAHGLTLFNDCWEDHGATKSEYDVLLDSEGNVRWYTASPACVAIDTTWLPGNHVLIGAKFHETVPTEIDLDGNVVFEAPKEPIVDNQDPLPFDHDIGPSVDETALYALTTEQGESWKGFIVEEISRETGDVTWTWDSVVDGVETGRLPKPTSDDPYHANAVFDADEDGRRVVYVSIREEDTILKIDRETKDILWTLGRKTDFQLLDEQGVPIGEWFAGQHDVKFSNGLIILHDNGTHDERVRATNATRALALDVDPVARTAQIAFQWTEDGWFEPALGGVDPLPDGGYTIAMGHFTNNAHRSALVDVTADGEVSWRAQFDDPMVTMYRSQRVDGCEAFPEAEALCATTR